MAAQRWEVVRHSAAGLRSAVDPRSVAAPRWEVVRRSVAALRREVVRHSAVDPHSVAALHLAGPRPTAAGQPAPA